VIGLFTGAASLVKFLALPAGPFLAGRRWPAALFGVLLAGLLYFPYLDPGVNVLGSLAEYVARWRSNDFLFALFVVPGTAADQVHRLAQARLLSVVVWALVAVLVILRKPEGPRAALIVLGTAILVAPTIHPWYVAWLVPLLAFEFSPAWFCLTLTVLLAYHPLPGFLAGAGWREIGWVKAIEFGTFSVLAAAEIAAALRRRDGRKAARSRESLPRTEPETV
jgi:hypothetical protein